MKTLDELMVDYETERLAEIAQYETRRASPAAQAALKAKREAEVQNALRNRRHSIRTERFCPISIWGVAR